MSIFEQGLPEEIDAHQAASQDTAYAPACLRDVVAHDFLSLVHATTGANFGFKLEVFADSEGKVVFDKDSEAAELVAMRNHMEELREVLTTFEGHVFYRPSET